MAIRWFGVRAFWIFFFKESIRQNLCPRSGLFVFLTKKLAEDFDPFQSHPFAVLLAQQQAVTIMA